MPAHAADTDLLSDTLVGYFRHAARRCWLFAAMRRHVAAAADCRPAPLRRYG